MHVLKYRVKSENSSEKRTRTDIMYERDKFHRVQ